MCFMIKIEIKYPYFKKTRSYTQKSQIGKYKSQYNIFQFTPHINVKVYMSSTQILIFELTIFKSTLYSN